MATKADKDAFKQKLEDDYGIDPDNEIATSLLSVLAGGVSTSGRDKYDCQVGKKYADDFDGWHFYPFITPSSEKKYEYRLLKILFRKYLGSWESTFEPAKRKGIGAKTAIYTFYLSAKVQHISAEELLFNFLTYYRNHEDLKLLCFKNLEVEVDQFLHSYTCHIGSRVQPATHATSTIDFIIDKIRKLISAKFSKRSANKSQIESVEGNEIQVAVFDTIGDRQIQYPFFISNKISTAFVEEMVILSAANTIYIDLCVPEKNIGIYNSEVFSEYVIAPDEDYDDVVNGVSIDGRIGWVEVYLSLDMEPVELKAEIEKVVSIHNSEIDRCNKMFNVNG